MVGGMGCTTWFEGEEPDVVARLDHTSIRFSDPKTLDKMDKMDKIPKTL